ncbi:MAG: AraC family transcriptional regulator [Phycisphaerae bacterium]|nr:AraC family transcriptional regulator [Phycisphaerae bacterium]
MRATLNHVGRVAPTVGWRMVSHRHERDSETIVVLRGRLAVRIRGQTIEASAGEALLYPAGEPHEERAVGGEQLETIFLSWRASRRQVERWPLKSSDGRGRLEYLARWMLDAWHTADGGRGELLASLLATLLHVYREGGRAGEDEMVARLRTFLQARLAKPLQLEDLANEVGVSRYYFVRLFRRRAGLTPMRFLRRLRVEAARTLLLTTPLPLRSIARQVGLGDEYHLSRVFLEVTGGRPSQLRHRPRGG